MSYKELKSYQQAVMIQDFTLEFCRQYVSQFSRTQDQMTQAARSGKQNIVEGTAVSKTSPKSELMLLGVARGSLEELLEDYKDFLRQKNLEVWEKDDPQAKALRQLVYKTDRTNRTDKTYGIYRSYLGDPESAANAMVVLINQTNYLLDQQMRAVREQMHQVGESEFSHSQKLSRILFERKQRDKEFDTYLQTVIEQGKKDGGGKQGG